MIGGRLVAGIAALVLAFQPIALAAQPAVPPRSEAAATTLKQAAERAILLLPDLAANQALREQAAAQRRSLRGPFVGPPVVSGDLALGTGGLIEQEALVSAGLRWPGERRAGRLAADLGVDVIGATLDEARLRIAGEVRTAWWSLAAAEAVVAVERGQAGLADQELAQIARLVDAGVQARRDLLLAEAERAAVRARLSTAEADLVAAQAAYEALAGPSPDRFPPEALATGSDIEDHPAVRATLARAAAADARVTALRFGTRPRIEGRVGVRRERIGARDGFENALLVGIGVPLGRDYSAVAETAGARSEAIRAGAEAARVRARLAAERTAGERRLALSRRAVLEAEARRAALAEALALTERGRREGEIGYVEALRARQTLGQASRDLAVARVAASAAISTFNQAQGVLP